MAIYALRHRNTGAFIGESGYTGPDKALHFTSRKSANEYARKEIPNKVVYPENVYRLIKAIPERYRELKILAAQLQILQPHTN